MKVELTCGRWPGNVLHDGSDEIEAEHLQSMVNEVTVGLETTEQKIIKVDNIKAALSVAVDSWVIPHMQITEPLQDFSIM